MNTSGRPIPHASTRTRSMPGGGGSERDLAERECHARFAGPDHLPSSH
jgi:hypothetical protein